MNSFFVFTNLYIVLKALEDNYLKNNSFSISNFTFAVNNKLKSIPNLVIIDPFLINQAYFTFSPIWKRYLSVHFPDSKLIVMGFIDHYSDNYIDLLNLPENFEAYFKNALPVREDWQIPIDGANMLEYMQRFFAGHGGHSLLSKLNALRQTFNIAYIKLADGDADFKEIWNELFLPLGKPEWEELIYRWKNYYPYFEYLPFNPAMQQINAVFSEISEFFACKFPDEALFLNQSIDGKLSSVHQQLVEIDRLYIRPEIYRETHSAPDR